MERVGNQGRYQFITLALLMIMAGIAGSMPLLTPFLFYQDPYECPQETTPKECKDWVCSHIPEERAAFIPKALIYSIANKYGDYRCPSEMQELTLLKTLMYSGALLGVLIMALVGGIISRKKLMMICQAICFTGLSLTVFSVSLWMAGFGMFLCILVGKMFLNLSFIWAM